MKNTMSKRFTLRLAVASVVGLVPAGASLADPGLPNAGAHQHILMTPNGVIPIGPDFCANPDLQNAFNQFHFNVHHSAIGRPPGVPVDTLGPQDGAPGLHNDLGADMDARACG